ncbi:MAG: hypothetical protein Fur0042_14870 [Cyanophyceae cyanobacterium]
MGTGGERAAESDSDATADGAKAVNGRVTGAGAVVVVVAGAIAAGINPSTVPRNCTPIRPTIGPPVLEGTGFIG